MDELKKVLLAGIGSIAYTYEKASKMVNDMVEKGKISVQEGMELSEELKRNFKDRTLNVVDKAQPLTKEDLKNVLEEYDFVSSHELNELKEKVNKLEERLNSME